MRDGWTWHAVAEDQASGAQAATYRRRKLRGANLLIASDAYELRGSLIKGSWTLRDPRGPVSVAVLRVKGDPPVVELELMPECHGIAELSLLLLFATWGVLIETALSFSDAPAGG